MGRPLRPGAGRAAPRRAAFPTVTAATFPVALVRLALLTAVALGAIARSPAAAAAPVAVAGVTPADVAAPSTAGPGYWRLEIGTAGGEPLAEAWAYGRDAAGVWHRLAGHREGAVWVFPVPADPPLEEVRFGGRPALPGRGTAGGDGEDAGPTLPNAAGDGVETAPASGVEDATGSALAWRVIWQDPAGGGAGGGEPVGRVLPPAPHWVPGIGSGGGPGGRGGVSESGIADLLVPPQAVERPRWSPPATSEEGRGRSGAGRGQGGEAPRSAPRPPALPPGAQGVVQLPAGIPAFEVTRPTFRTTDWKPLERGHVLWRWNFGDGTTWLDPVPDHAIVRQPHRFGRPGSYTVEAVSYDVTGRALIRYRWQVTIPPAEAVARTLGAAIPGVLDDAALAAAQELARWRLFAAAAPQAPRVSLELEGPRHWVVGRPALFRLRAHIQNPPFTERVEVDYDPGPVFSVRWRRPGTFAVDGAVRVRVYYRIHGRALALSHVYRVTRSVEVHALHLEE